MLQPAEAQRPLELSFRQVSMDVDRLLDDLLTPPADRRRRLYDAMRHAAIGGGKRLRPLLVIASADLFGVDRAQALRAAVAVECVHVHSLIHDDLPCMDDDDLRRGKPTVHKAYDEATAVLAGDALHALAFQILADPATHSDGTVRCNLIRELAEAAGAAGMAGGQMLDLFPDELTDVDGVIRLQRLKTGALIGWSAEAGAIMADAQASVRMGLRGYGHCLGLAFQIADDLLDVDGDEAKAGKRLRKDADAGKASFVSLLGSERARAQARFLIEQAKDHLRPFGSSASLLSMVADFAVTRDH
jgi:farnesyl diphosphate synthase